MKKYEKYKASKIVHCPECKDEMNRFIYRDGSVAKHFCGNKECNYYGFIRYIFDEGEKE